ncbi:hypothetical protein Pfo_017973 [Paulownia fortunei]|nr:hypothetical protein Pfo_017973 [Paulownia fortunei]
MTSTSMALLSVAMVHTPPPPLSPKPPTILHLPDFMYGHGIFIRSVEKKGSLFCSVKIPDLAALILFIS